MILREITTLFSFWLVFDLDTLVVVVTAVAVANFAADGDSEGRAIDADHGARKVRDADAAYESCRLIDSI